MIKNKIENETFELQYHTVSFTHLFNSISNSYPEVLGAGPPGAAVQQHSQS